MTTTIETMTANFGPDPAWCTASNAGHLTGSDDAEWDDGQWRRGHDGGFYSPVPDRGGWFVSWGAEEIADSGPMEFTIELDSIDEPALTPAHARRLAAYLIDAADTVEAAQH